MRSARHCFLDGAAAFAPWWAARHVPRFIAVLACLLVPLDESARACPFCTALKPSLSQQRDAAGVAAMAELLENKAGQPLFLLHKVLKGAETLGGRDRMIVPLQTSLEPGALVLLFGAGPAEAKLALLSWTAIGVNETSYAYFVRAPSLRTATADRLRYFAPFLEHAEPLIAEDAYLEFGHAPYTVVAQVIDLLPMDRVRGWMADEHVPPERKGFYGLALGLASGAAERAKNAEFLRGLILRPQNDFRAGFDGVLGGYLMLTGETGLALVEERYLANPRAADGDVRHSLTALRFYHEFGHAIPPARLCAALRLLLARPEFADAAVTDLARWQDWSALDKVTALYRQKSSTPATRRAVVGFLLVCPESAAAHELAELKQSDPAGVAEAQRTLSTLGGVKQ